MSKTYTWSELQHHNKTEDLFIVVRGSVYDVTKFQHEHPGGPEFLLDQGGGDVTELFEDAGHSEEARSILKKLKIGVVEGKANDTEETSSRENIGGLAGFRSRRHTIPAFFFIVLGLLFHYYYQNPNTMLPAWRELLLAPN
ncbi:cytochrome b5-like heme/Steroid binding domain-containing protein [Trichoderma breve]|uniref:Cytochrome b5-like heme/Steroid binding domain-containing protein n=1 Tax=Trichoderma breve TaxID=2034170 RepID=A0A9W9B8T5_9HYPO|nr:cytochrome b5-like heme/Steroid binding domain-containing protein [Trichoderma breve]KAJ4858074.1 cytochrome b5-like heme/Steroid binding domain-containing protein [Trichoderma breve]